MHFEIDEIDSKEGQTNYWMLCSDLTKRQYLSMEKKNNTAYEYFEKGLLMKAGPLFRKLIDSYGIECLDAYSFLSMCLVSTDSKKAVLDDGYNQVMSKLLQAGYKDLDRIEYGFLEHRPLFRLLYNTGKFYFDSGIDKKKGLEIYTFLYKLDPDSDPYGIDEIIVWDYIKNGKYDLAFALCKPSLTEEYINAIMAYAASLIAFKQDNIEAAKRYFKMGFDRTPIFGHLVLMPESELKIYLEMNYDDHTFHGVLMGSLTESILILKNCHSIWEEHFTSSQIKRHRGIIWDIVRSNTD